METWMLGLIAALVVGLGLASAALVLGWVLRLAGYLFRMALLGALFLWGLSWFWLHHR